MSLKGAVVDGTVAGSGVPGKTGVGTAIVCVVAVVMAAVMLTYVDSLTREVRETALRMGLGNIRISVQLYYALNERYPEDLKELLTTGYALSTSTGRIFGERYLDAQGLDAEGYPVDPFGRRYRYDPVGGRVLSESEGYEQW